MKRSLTLFIFAFGLAVSGVAEPPELSPRDQTIRQIMMTPEFMLERDYESAENNIREVLRGSPKNILALQQLAHLLVVRGREEEAVPVREKVKSLYPKASLPERCYIDITTYPFPKGKESKLQPAEVREMADKNPDDYLANYVAGLYFNNLPDAELTCLYLERAVKLAPWLGQAHNLLGYTYTYLRRYDKAVSHLREYARIYPDRANPHDSLGESYFMTGRYDESITEFQAALAINPSFTAARLHLIDAYQAKGQYTPAKQQALKIWEKAESDDQKVVALAFLSEIFRHRGDLAHARSKAEAILALKPESNAGFFQLGMALWQMGRWDELQQVLDRWAVILNRKSHQNSSGKKWSSSDYDFLLAKLNASLGNFNTAIELFQKINTQILIPHQSIDVKHELAEAFFAMGDSKTTLGTLNQILEINPNYVPSLSLRARLYASKSKPDLAKKDAKRCLDILRDADRSSPQYVEVINLYNQLQKR